MKTADKPEVAFGNVETIKILDAEGSTVTSDENIRNYEYTRPVRKRYKIKTRVHDQREEHVAYMKFSDDIKNDRTKLETSFKIERNKIGDQQGYYYTVDCYTQLEY